MTGTVRASRLAAAPAAVLAAALTVTLALGACAGDGGPPPPPDERAPGRVQACKAGDTRVARESDCLRDDAACYALADGGWCTGARGNACPAGSAAVPAGAPCPPGARCFAIGESLTCTIAIE